MHAKSDSPVHGTRLHPTLDVLVTAGRDASARVWDMRTKAQVHILTGHTATISDVQCQESDPQVITGSMDSTVRCVALFFSLPSSSLLAPGLTHSITPQAVGPRGGQDDDDPDAPSQVGPLDRDPPDRVLVRDGVCRRQQHQKVGVPNGTFVHNFSGHDAIINSVSVNHDGVFFSGGASQPLVSLQRLVR